MVHGLGESSPIRACPCRGQTPHEEDDEDDVDDEDDEDEDEEEDRDNVVPSFQDLRRRHWQAMIGRGGLTPQQQRQMQTERQWTRQQWASAVRQWQLQRESRAE